MRSSQRGWLAGVTLLATATLGLGACSHPRIVTYSSVTRASMKLLYREAQSFGPADVGIIKCDATPDGALSNCRRMAVQLEE